MTKDLVSIIIVNWNGLEHLKKCLPSLYSQAYKNIEVILVDNGSKDNSVNWVKRNFPNTIILENNKNLGFAEANNIGFKVVKGEYVLFLNNDTEVTKYFLIKLLKALKVQPKLGGVQSKILFMDNHEQFDSVGSYMTNTGFLYHKGVYEKDNGQFDKKFLVYSLKGACMLFKTEVLQKVEVEGEILDSRFFAYFEETDLCHRVWLAGYQTMFIPDSVIYHKFGATSVKLLKPFVEYNSYKNRINSYLKNLGVRKLITILPLHLLICESLSLYFFLKGKREICSSIQKAIIWNCKNIIPTLRKRIIIQSKIRKVKDDIIWQEISRNPRIEFYVSQLTGWNIDKINAKNI